MVPHYRTIMSAHNDDCEFQGILVEDTDNNMRNQAYAGEQHETLLEEAMEREMRELAQLQEQWGNPRDLLRDVTSVRQDGDDLGGETQADTSSPTMSTLVIAQHEWRKVLEGTNGSNAGRPILPVTDAIANVFWGDACQVKAEHIFRIYAQNVNGIPLDCRGGQFDTLCQAQKGAQADMFLGQEHNLDSTQCHEKSILHDKQATLATLSAQYHNNTNHVQQLHVQARRYLHDNGRQRNRTDTLPRPGQVEPVG
jgi:hypothetical protein